MLKELKPAVLMMLVMTIVTGLAYPAVITVLAQLMFPAQANGSMVTVDGRVVGSRLIGQDFKKPEYFHPRPSAAGTNGYDPMASGGSNLGPTSARLFDDVRRRVEAYRVENALASDTLVPADAVTTSASGLDPHISPRNAELQIARVARARGISAQRLRTLIEAHTEPRTFGILGEPRVNVLELNLALDRLASGSM